MSLLRLMAEEKVNEWELTEEEKKEGAALSVERSAFLLQAETQHRIAIRFTEADKRWWGNVLRRLGLDINESPGFIYTEGTVKISRR